MLNVLHVIPSVSETDGGPSFALRLMTRELARLGLRVSVATTHSCAVSPASETLLGVAYHSFARQSEFYKLSFPFARWASKNLRHYDLIHIHALFSFTSTWAARVARRERIPYIVRPLGVLNRWGVENRRPALKRASINLVEAPILRNAAAIHYTSSQERAEASLLKIPFAREAVIPLGIDLSPFAQMPGPAAFLEKFPQAGDRPIVLFLSRIDRKKGLDTLLRAFAPLASSASSPLLVIAGSGDPALASELRALARDLNIEKHILWTGFISGPEKLSLLSAATLFVLPSHSENFGIAAVEALAAGLPSILSDGVAVSSDASAADAAFVVPPSEHQLRLAIAALLSDPAKRLRLSENARALALSRFSVQSMGQSLFDLYNSILSLPCPLPFPAGPSLSV